LSGSLDVAWLLFRRVDPLSILARLIAFVFGRLAVGALAAMAEGSYERLGVQALGRTGRIYVLKQGG
jgi:hypothetical protein